MSSVTIDINDRTIRTLRTEANSGRFFLLSFRYEAHVESAKKRGERGSLI